MKKRKLLIILSFIACLFIVPNTIKAASFSASASSYNVAVGSSVKVYISSSDLTGRFDVSSSSSSVLSGGGKVWVEKNSQSVTFTAKSAGRVKVNITPTNVSDNSGKQYSTSKSLIINVYVPRALETNNYLSSLSVDGVELIPSFNKETTAYIVDLEPGTTSIKVNAEKENKYASISGTGDIAVVEGSNEINVVVTAENGSKKTYTITANVKEYDPINVTIDSSDYTVVRKTSELVKPDGYEETSVDINGNQVPAFKNDTLGYTLVGLKDVTGKVKLFIYDNGAYKPYIFLSFNKLDLIILDEEVKAPKGFVKDTITIGEETVTCYKNNELGITIIYGKSITTGEANFYTFENTDMTIQKFNYDMYKKMLNKFDLYSYIIIGEAGLILLILFIVLVSSIARKKKLTKKKEEIEKTMKLNPNDINNQVKELEEKNLSKKELKRLKKEQQKEKEKQEELNRKKEEALEEQKRIEEKNKKKLDKKNKKNKDKKTEKDDDMFYL